MEALQIQEGDIKGALGSLGVLLYMWWTPPPFLASSSVLGTLFSSENSLFTRL